MTSDAEAEIGKNVMARIRARRRRPAIRVIIAHIIACYLFAGELTVVSMIAKAINQTVPVSTDDDDDLPWYLVPWCIFATAPFTVPVGLAVMSFFTIASPVERIPILITAPTILLFACQYFGIWFSMYWRDRRNDPSLSGFPVTLKKPNGFD